MDLSFTFSLCVPVVSWALGEAEEGVLSKLLSIYCGSYARWSL